MEINIELLHEIQLDILKEFHNFCLNNNISYQLSAGTLLGAVRHNGFIPWDDDIDVRMLREDYEKFIHLSNEEYSKKYFIQTIDTDKNYVHNFARIHKKNTTLIQEGWLHVDMYKGIFIDIFPFDGIPDKKILKWIQYHLIFSLQLLRLIRRRSLLSEKTFIAHFKNFIVKLISILPIRTYINLENRVLRMFNSFKNNDVTCFVDGGRSTYKRLIIDKKHFSNSVLHNFENQEFMIPKNYDKILKKAYGDYMKLPPSNKQIPHHGIIFIDYNKYVDFSQGAIKQ